MAVFEVDGLKNPVYCENLSFLSKLFLDHKNIELNTTVFLYYVLCEITQDQEYHLAGYFSKVKQSSCSPRTHHWICHVSWSYPINNEKGMENSSSLFHTSLLELRVNQAPPKNRFLTWEKRHTWHGGHSGSSIACEHAEPTRIKVWQYRIWLGRQAYCRRISYGRWRRQVCWRLWRDRRCCVWRNPWWMRCTVLQDDREDQSSGSTCIGCPSASSGKVVLSITDQQ